MKIISWNVNGLNNILSKTKEGLKCSTHVNNNSLIMLSENEEPDIICLQEVRCNKALALLKLAMGERYPYIYTHCAQKAGYSGTAIISKIKPIDVTYDLHDEGRLICATFTKFALITVYSPNSKPKLERLEYRIKTFEVFLREFINRLSVSNKKIILCGDLNVANEDIDIHNPKSNHKSAGFTNEERTAFKTLITECKLIDTFRYAHPTTVKYSWWTNFHKSRERNKGWRIDYFLLTSASKRAIKEADILTEYMGSDHAPVLLVI